MIVGVGMMPYSVCVCCLFLHKLEDVWNVAYLYLNNTPAADAEDHCACVCVYACLCACVCICGMEWDCSPPSQQAIRLVLISH